MNELQASKCQTLLRASRALQADLYLGVSGSSRWQIASTSRGSRVILCMGSSRKEIMGRPWQAGFLSRRLIASDASGRFLQ